MEDKLLTLLNNLCNGFIADGDAYEEVIDMLVESGASIPVLKAIGFSDDQIADYAYYISMIDNISEEAVMGRLMDIQ